uniref:Uncharacterized protein n=1 Tax=Hyaloperonospora arabidopsidis (strain Emoy2) TaxID=559515 RepID=M4C688_HYAAE
MDTPGLNPRKLHLNSGLSQFYSQRFPDVISLTSEQLVHHRAASRRDIGCNVGCFFMSDVSAWFAFSSVLYRVDFVCQCRCLGCYHVGMRL